MHSFVLFPPVNSLWHPRLFSGHKTRENEEITEVRIRYFLRQGGEGGGGGFLGKAGSV